MLRADFGVTSKNSYSFIFGPTNHDGCAVLQKQTILKEATAQLNLALMDYHPLAGVFDGLISLKPMRDEKIIKALDAYKLYRNLFPYPADYEKSLRDALLVISEIDIREIRVKPHCKLNKKEGANFSISALLDTYKNGGERGIRTPGSLRLTGFQDRSHKPLDHLSDVYRRTRNVLNPPKSVQPFHGYKMIST